MDKIQALRAAPVSTSPAGTSAPPPSPEAADGVQVRRPAGDKDRPLPKYGSSPPGDGSDPRRYEADYQGDTPYPRGDGSNPPGRDLSRRRDGVYSLEDELRPWGYGRDFGAEGLDPWGDGPYPWRDGMDPPGDDDDPPEEGWGWL
jgi:hypothetical protein